MLSILPNFTEPLLKKLDNINNAQSVKTRPSMGISWEIEVSAIASTETTILETIPVKFEKINCAMSANRSAKNCVARSDCYHAK